MSNYFDQFDDKPADKKPKDNKNQSNYFDQFDDTPTYPLRPGGPPPLGHPAPPATPPTQRNYGFFEALGEGARNLPKGLVDFGTSVRDAYLGLQNPTDAVPAVAGAVATIPGVLGQLIGGVYLNLTPEQTREQLLAASPEEFAPMIEAANTVGGLYRERYGDWDAIKRTIAEHPYAFAADAATLLTMPGTGTVARAAGQQAARVLPSGVTNTAKALHYGLVPTHGLNDGAGVFANRTVPAAAGYVERVTHPTNAMIERTAEGRGSEINNALFGTPRSPHNQIIYNNIPTPAQAVTGAGVVAPRFSALGRDAERRFPAQATDIRNQQNAARINHIQENVGGTPADIEYGIQRREIDASRNYGVANQVTSVADAALYDLLTRPSMQHAIRRARQIAAETPREFPSGNPANVPSRAGNSPALGGGTNAMNSPTLGGSNAPDIPGQYFSGADLHLLKQALDDLTNDPSHASRFGIGAAEINQIRNTRRELIEWIERNNPDYRTARTQYHAQSRNIDQMRIGQYLQRQMQNPTLGENTITQQADNFSRSVNDAVVSNPSISRATGQRRYDNLDEILTPEQMQAVSEVGDDFARNAMNEAHANIGSRYSGALETAFSDALGVHPDRWWTRPLVAGQNRRIADDVGQRMLTLDGASELTQDALRRRDVLNNRRRVYDLGLRVNAFINPFGYANRYPMTYNILGAQQEQNQNAMNR